MKALRVGSDGGNTDSLDKSVSPFKRIGDDETVHPRLCPHPVHDVPIHSSCDRFGDLDREVVAISLEVMRRVVNQMPRTPILRLKIIEYSPADVVQEFGDLAGMIHEDIADEPLEEVIDREIRLLLTHRMASGLKQLAKVSDISRETSQIMFCDVTAYLDVLAAFDAQICDYIDSGQIDAWRDEVAIEPVGKDFNPLVKAGRLHAEFRVGADLPKMEDEG